MQKQFKQLQEHAITWRIIFILLVIVTANLSAQDTGQHIAIGQTIQLESKILKENRLIQVYLPNNYEESQEKYPVIYLLDSRRNFHYITGHVGMYGLNGKMPQVIVIGIINTDRLRDMTPTKSTRGYWGNTEPRLGRSGGANNFLGFIEKELMPYVNKHYRTAPYNTLLGHSQGGVFTFYALMKNPRLFRAYISLSPALWWDNKVMVGMWEKFLASKPDLKDLSLYFTAANEGGEYLKSVEAFKTLLDKHTPQGLLWRYKHFDKETHGSMFLKGSYNGIALAFDGWGFHGLGRKKPADLEARHKELERKYGYQIRFPMGVLSMMGYVAMQEKRYQDAVDIFLNCIKRNPENRNFYLQVAEGYRQLGKKEQAAKYDKLAEQRQ